MPTLGSYGIQPTDKVKNYKKGSKDKLKKNTQLAAGRTIDAGPYGNKVKKAKMPDLKRQSNNPRKGLRARTYEF